MNRSPVLPHLRLSTAKVLFFALGLCFSKNVQAQSDTVQVVDEARKNDPSQQKKPIVILISVDGLRSDYVNKYHATNLARFSSQGAVADYMVSSFPSLTFPNHYSLVTGLYPAHHGLVDNQFYDNRLLGSYDMHQRKKVEDGEWYGGIPLWVLAEEQKMLTASFYWVGSDAPIQGIFPTYYYHYNEKIPVERRLTTVRDWLHLPEERRPHLITFYFPEVDHQGHTYGPDAKETEEAVHQVDENIGKMVAMTDSLHLAVNYIIVSDHGMATADTEHPITVPPAILDTALCRLTVGATIIHVYIKDAGKISALYQELKKSALDYDAYLPQQIPAGWHYGKNDDRFKRVGDILLVSHYPKVFKTGTRAITPGKHGFDPSLIEMRATFMAWGPQVKKAKIKSFENVNVFPFIAELLGLSYSHTIDGTSTVLKAILK